MTDSSMNFGPAWIRNLHSEGTSISSGGGTSGGTKYQLAEHRYGREEMLALFDKSVKPPPSLVTFKPLYSEQTLVPLALVPTTEEELRGWQIRPTTISGPPRGRGSSLERGGRLIRGRGAYQAYNRAASAYDSGWGNGEQPDWSPRKDFANRSAPFTDNWRRVRSGNDDDDGWRNISTGRSLHEKWGRSSSWRGDGDSEERNGPPERGARPNWHENSRGGPLRRSWDNEDHLPEWATENPTEGGGTFDERGAFHGSDDEQESRREGKRDVLQKSTSQQHIPNRGNPPSLSTSKSTTSLIKSDDSCRYKEEPCERECVDEHNDISREKGRGHAPVMVDRRDDEKTDKKVEESKSRSSEKSLSSNGPPPQELSTPGIDKVDEDFDRLQEDLVLKLVVDEETPKTNQPPPNFDVSSVQPPPNLAPPSQEKWYYQDPQGTRQGPFPNHEMAEWYKAGYFSNQLHVMRECDERYFLLGELITLCGGENPFFSNIRFPILKNDTAKLPEEMVPYQLLSKLAFQQQVSMRNLAEPWSTLTLQQQELAAQRLALQQQQQIPHDLQFMQQNPISNPLVYMFKQLQQNNKLPGSVLVDKPSSNVPNQLDPLLLQMGNLHTLQNRIQTAGLHNHLSPSGVSTNLSSSLPSEGLGNTLPNLQAPPIASLPGLHGSLPNALPGSVPTNRLPQGSLDPLPPNQENDPLTNFLKQFQQRQMPVDSLWQKQNQFNVPPAVSAPPQWPQQPETPLSMWDLQTPPASMPSDVQQQLPPPEIPQQENEEEQKPKEEQVSQKELKKRKELEEKQTKKEADERRKLEQKKQEAEKKTADEKKKKEEERLRKELEKAKKDAEEKRMRELEEKRRLKEQRKAEEEARRKSEDVKKQEDDRIRRETKEREDRRQADAARLGASKSASKSAPWSQSSGLSQGLALTDIQKAEKERKAQEAAMLLKIQQLQELQQHQQEKQGGLQLNWAKKPMEARKVKSFAEIQAEEQERLAKLTAEARLAAQLKEKETPLTVNPGNIWNGQSLTWANASSTSQWSSNNTGGFWDEVPAKPSNKPSTVSKSNSTSAMTTTKQQPQQQKQSKNKSKKEETLKSVNNNNNNQSKDEFTDWCYKTLSNITADVDIPTFVTFLRDIESAYDVRDYCKEYLGDSPATQQFASNFLEKRRSFKPKNNAHKDDMCSPAPAITPSMQHNTEFQEVKGKNKKNKKSKMLKVDSRILGFNVTSAPDRINLKVVIDTLSQFLPRKKYLITRYLFSENCTTKSEKRKRSKK